MPRSPRVLLVSGIYPPDVGGPASFVPQLRRYLLDQGWAVRVVAISKDSSATEAGVDIVERRVSPIMRRARFMMALLGATRGADVVFANGLHGEVGLVTRALRKPWVAKVVGETLWERARNGATTSGSLLEFHSGVLPFLSRTERNIWLSSLDTASSVIVPGPELQELLTGLGLGDHTILIPNGVSTAGNEGGPRREAVFDIVTACRLTEWKGVDKLIEMSSRLGVSLLVIGDGPQRSRLEDLAASLGCETSVTFLGQVPSGEVSAMLSQARLFALLSSYEGMSFALLEAKSVGLAAVASDIPGNRAVVRHGVDGLLVDPTDSHALDVAASGLLSDGDRLALMGEEARLDAVERFSMDAVLRATEAQLLSAMGAR